MRNSILLRRYLLTGMLVGLVLPAVSSAAEFEWVSPQHNPAVFEQIQRAFSPETNPNKNKITLSTGEFHIPTELTAGFKLKAGVVGDKALVIVFADYLKGDLTGLFAKTYGYDLKLQTKTPISSKGDPKTAETFQVLEVREVETIDPTGPDVFLHYYGCVDCETYKEIASLHFDRTARTWSFRDWGNAKAITVSEMGDMGEWQRECKWRFPHFKPGLKKLEVECWEVSGKKNKNLGKTDWMCLPADLRQNDNKNCHVQKVSSLTPRK